MKNLRSVSQKVVVLGLFALLCRGGFIPEAVHAQSGVEFNPNRSATDFSGDEIEHTESDAPKKKPVKAVSFSKYGPFFRLICANLRDDGRRDTFFYIIEPLDYDFEDHPGGRAFLRSFLSACRAKKEKAGAQKTPAPAEVEATEGEDAEHSDEAPPTPAPTPKPKPLPREPSTKLINAISTGFNAIAEDDKRAADAAHAADVISKALEDPEDKTPGERDYFGIMAVYFRAPFLAILQEPKHEVSEEGEGEEKEVAPPPVDDLFEH
jgi:hypothetical protein